MCEQSRKKEEEKKTKWARRVGKKKKKVDIYLLDFKSPGTIQIVTAKLLLP